MPAMPKERLEETCRILGITADADAEKIRRRFKQLAFEYHPDRHGGDPKMEGKFLILSSAYRELMDHVASRPAEEAAREDPGAAAQGRRYFLPLEFIKGVRGGEVAIRFHIFEECPICHGQGGGTCVICGGSGEIRSWAFRRISLPSGLEDGEEIRIPRDDGEDLKLVISYKPHPLLIRRGLDVFSEVRAPAAHSGHEFNVNVLTIWGIIVARIPAGATSEQLYCLRGAGIRRSVDGRFKCGDHYFRLVW